MANAKNKKVTKKRKPANKSKGRNSSDQKENGSKTPTNKVTNHKLDDGIAISKQLLMKNRSVRSSSSRIERVCANGKPVPSLAELEKMYEDSDDDEQPQNTCTKNSCEPSTPKQQIPESNSENKLMSPSTINKISERLLDFISNISDPIELLDDITTPPVIPQKKRKKPDQPYIVGCKDRPQVSQKSNNNKFCKGGDEYGVEASAADPEEPLRKRAKKSNIPKYSNSIFNAHTDEIAERLNKDTEGLRESSSDSNETIEYSQSQSSHSFSPVASTSKDNETFKMNDELFNQSINKNIIFKNTTPEDIQNEVKIIDNPHDIIVIDHMAEEEMPVKIKNTSNEADKTIDVIIEIDTKNKGSQDNNVKCIIINDDDDTLNDCIIVPSSPKNTNQPNQDQTIEIDDEYSGINLDYSTFDREPIDIIVIDDVIAENESILGKWKNNGTEKFNMIDIVVEVPTTYKNSTTPQSSVTPSTSHNLSKTNVHTTPQSSETPNKNHNLINTNVNTTPQSSETPSTNHNLSNTNVNTTPQSSETPSTNHILSNTNVNITSTQNTQNNRRLVQLDLDKHTGNAIEKVVDDFFKKNKFLPTYDETTEKRKEIGGFLNICDAILSTLNNSQATSTPTAIHSQPSTSNISTPRQRCYAFKYVRSKKNHQTMSDLSNSGISEKQQTHNPAARDIGDCPICMDPLSTGRIASTICGHVFCLSCIKAAIRVNGKRCPTCRKVLKGGGYHQVFL